MTNIFKETSLWSRSRLSWRRYETKNELIIINLSLLSRIILHCVFSHKFVFRFIVIEESYEKPLWGGRKYSNDLKFKFWWELIGLSRNKNSLSYSIRRDQSVQVILISDLRSNEITWGYFIWMKQRLIGWNCKSQHHDLFAKLNFIISNNNLNFIKYKTC